MKNKILTASTTVLLVCLHGAALGQDLPETTISVIGSSDESYMHQNLEKPFWTETIAERSNGAIKVDFKGLFSSGLKGPEIVRLLRSGAIDFAHGVFQSVGGDDATFEGLDLAGLSPDIETARAVAEAYRPVIDGNFREKHNLKLLAMLPFSANMLFCRDPIESLADLKGRKVRVFGRTLADFVGAVGASSATIPYGEVVPALQTGVVDCAITGVSSANSSKWFEVADYLYTIPLAWATSFYAINLDRWNSLDPAVQAFLEENIGKLEDDIWALTARQTQDGLNCNAGVDPCEFGSKAAMTVVALTDGDRDELKRIMQEVVVPAWAERCGPECSAKWNETVGQTVDITIE
jgi:TRAP-type C4-dicarboxylate transport system substrate-binding protein